MKKSNIFYLVFFTAFLFFWLFNMFNNPEQRVLAGVMFIIHIGLVYFYSSEILEDIKK
jgi:prepilin signal peptidase PulO-like enzyme (type II secretory pathway)